MKVKVIKVDDRFTEFEKKDAELHRIGKIYEAIEFKDEFDKGYERKYVMPLEGNGFWILPVQCCEIIPDDSVITVDNQIIKKENILLVEDGSVDTDQLEQDGFYLITYRNGSTPPMWLK